MSSAAADELTDATLSAYLGIAEACWALADPYGVDSTMDELSGAYDRSGLSALEYYRSWVAYNVGGVRVVQALVAGRFDEAERCIDLVEEIPTDLASLKLCVTIGRAQLAHLRGNWDDVRGLGSDDARRASRRPAPRRVRAGWRAAGRGAAGP